MCIYCRLTYLFKWRNKGFCGKSVVLVFTWKCGASIKIFGFVKMFLCYQGMIVLCINYFRIKYLSMLFMQMSQMKRELLRIKTDVSCYCNIPINILWIDNIHYNMWKKYSDGIGNIHFIEKQVDFPIYFLYESAFFLPELIREFFVQGGDLLWISWCALCTYW